MSRVEKPELLRELVRLKSDLAALSGKQFVGGDSLTGALTISPDSSDLTVSLPALAGSQKRYIMSFTATAGSVALASLFPFYSIDNSNVLGFAVPPWSGSPMVGLVVQRLGTSGAVTSWWLQFLNADGTNTAHTAYFKYVISGTDSGSVSFTLQ